jgi:uncharacterized membrane protein YuzA (DUF378 family)
MKINFSAICKKILNPPTWVKILNFIITILSATGALVMVLIGFEKTALEVIAYFLFGIAGLSLAYSIYLIIPLFPKLKKRFIALMEKNNI